MATSVSGALAVLAVVAAYALTFASVSGAITLIISGYADAHLLSFSTGLILACVATYMAYHVIRATIVALTAFWVYRWKPWLRTWMIARSKISPTRNPEKLRQVFKSVVMPKRKTRQNAPHKDSAADRTLGRRFADQFCLESGVNKHVIQQSRSDQLHGSRGDRTYYWAKDITVDPSYTIIPDAGKVPLVHMVDVDYYINMPWFLAWYSTPVLLHTFVPSTAAKADGDYSYSFNRDGWVTYRTHGSGEYHHQLWDYGTDSLICSWTIYGIPIKTTLYKVDRRNISANHMAILLSPLGSFWGIFAWLASQLEGKTLTRLVTADPDAPFTRLYIQRENGLYVSTARLNTHLSVTLPIEEDDAIAAKSRLGKVEITDPGVQTITGHEDRDFLEATVLTEYHRLKTGYVPAVVYPVEYSVNNYTHKPDEYVSNPKPSMLAYMAPIIPGCFAPTQTLANEKAAVEGRIEKVAADVTANEEFCGYIGEFIDLLVPKKHCLGPSPVEEVFERQNRPSQRSILTSALSSGGKITGKPKSFLKAEIYMEPKDPRIITTICPEDKLEYSRYLYPSADHFKEHAPWYAFGKSPKETAEYVAHIAMQAKSHGSNSDLNRFDGRLTHVFRILERSFLVNAFPPAHHDRVSDLHDRQFQRHANTRQNVKYYTGEARLSGSPETSLFNSMDNAYMHYCTFRRMGYAPVEAWEALGIYGGDDGFTTDIDIELYKSTVAELGMKSTVEKIDLGKFGVKFLARQYGPGVWSGDCNSCCDIPRQLTKFHVSGALPPRVTPEDKLVEKSRGYFLSDGHTPVIGEIAARVMELDTPPESDQIVVELDGGISRAQQHRTDYAKELRQYSAYIGGSEQYPNEPSDWMEHYAEESLGPYHFDRARLREALAKATCLQDLLRLPQCGEPLPVVTATPVVINDSVVKPVPPKPEAAPKPQVAQPTPPKVEKKQREKRSGKAASQKQGGVPEKTIPPVKQTQRPPLEVRPRGQARAKKSNKDTARPARPKSPPGGWRLIQRLPEKRPPPPPASPVPAGGGQ